MRKAVLVLIFVDRTGSVKWFGCHDADHDELNEIAQFHKTYKHNTKIVKLTIFARAFLSRNIAYTRYTVQIKISIKIHKIELPSIFHLPKANNQAVYICLLYTSDAADE